MNSGKPATDFIAIPDQLIRAAQYARLLRNAHDPQSSLTELQRRFGLPQNESAAIALARVAAGPAGQQKEVLALLKGLARTQIVNRSPEAAPSSEREVIDPEALRLSQVVNDEDQAVRIFGDTPGFSLLQRAITIYADEIDEFPGGTRLLIDYPLDSPRLFHVACDCDYASVCDAIADAYDRIYSDARANGVILHDLSDLVIEDVLFFPKERLLYPHIGS